MRKIIALSVLFIAQGAFAYFDAGINYTSGEGGYKGQDAYLKIGSGGLWVKPEYSSYDADGIDAYRKYSARVGIERDLYTFSAIAGLTPEVTYLGNKYKNKFVGADITFSLNPTSGGRNRMVGPNSGYSRRSASGVTQIDLGAGVDYTAHTSNSKDLAQIDASLFAGVKILMAQISASYTASSYDKTMTIDNAGGYAMNERPLGLDYYFIGYPKSNFNVKVDLIGYPMVTPFLSYNKTKFKLATEDDVSTYGIGAYIDLNMVGATVSWQTMKWGTDRNNYLSFSAGLKF